MKTTISLDLEELEALNFALSSSPDGLPQMKERATKKVQDAKELLRNEF